MALTARHRWCMSKLVEAFGPDVDASKSQVQRSTTMCMYVCMYVVNEMAERRVHNLLTNTSANELTRVR